jgi:transposase
MKRQSHKQLEIGWRRNKVLAYLVGGLNQYEIADILHVTHVTIYKYVTHLKEQSREQMKNYIDEQIREKKQY